MILTTEIADQLTRLYKACDEARECLAGGECGICEEFLEWAALEIAELQNKIVPEGSL